MEALVVVVFDTDSAPDSFASICTKVPGALMNVVNEVPVRLRIINALEAANDPCRIGRGLVAGQSVDGTSTAPLTDLDGADGEHDDEEAAAAATAAVAATTVLYTLDPTTTSGCDLRPNDGVERRFC